MPYDTEEDNCDPATAGYLLLNTNMTTLNMSKTYSLQAATSATPCRQYSLQFTLLINDTYDDGE